MQKIKLLLGLLAIALLILTGCGGQPPADSSEAPATEVEEAPPEEPAAEVEAAPKEEPAKEEPAEEVVAEPETARKLTFSTWGNPTFFEDGFNRMKAANSEYAGAEWEYLPGGGGTEDLLAKLIVDFAAESWETMPDVAEMSTSYIPQLAAAGVLVDLTAMVEPYRNDISPAILEGVTWDGKIYAIPWMPNTAMIWYNQEVFEMAGINADEIETWQDFIDAGLTIKNFEFPDGQQRYITNADTGWGPGMMIQIMMQQQCSGFFDPETGDLTIEDDPAFRNVMEFWATAYDLGILLPGEEWETAWFDGLNEGLIASYPSANWMDQVIQLDLENAEGKWRAMKLPAFEAGGSRASFEGGSANVVVLNKPDIDMDLVWAFIEYSFLNGDETGDLAASHMLVPAYIPALEHPYYTSPNDFYGGQTVGQLDREIQEAATCAFPYTEYYAESLDLILVEIQEVWAGNKTVDEAIADAAEAIRFAVE